MTEIVFTLGGRPYVLATNNGPNALHGGNVGFDKVLWRVVSAEGTREGARLALSHRSLDGDEGYPGTLEATATYTLGEDDSLRLDFTATTDRTTVVNLTQHSYFNLRGHGDVLGHELRIPASRFTPIDDGLIPTGERRPVQGTPFDFRSSTAIGVRINAPDEQIAFGKGYDHNWIMDDARGLHLQAAVHEPETGRLLEVRSTEPGLQFYSGNFLDGNIVGKRGQRYERRSGFCLEPQHFPDSPNHPDFPSTVLKPGQTYRNTIEYRFSVR